MSLPGVELDPFPDVELMCREMLTDLAPTGVETPSDLGEDGAYIRAVRTGGADDGITDRPIVGITTYAPTRAASWALTRELQQRLLAAGGTVVQVGDEPVLIDRVMTFTGPLENPDQNPNVRAVPTYFVIEFRRPRR